MPDEILPRVAAAVEDVDGLWLNGPGDPRATQLRVRATKPASATVSELIQRVSDQGLHVAYLMHGTMPYPWTSIRLYDDDPQEHFIVTVRYIQEPWPAADG